MNEPSVPLQFILFLLTGTMTVSSLADFYYTTLGIDRGFKEGNPIFRFLSAHMSRALAWFIVTSACILTSFMAAKFVGIYYGIGYGVVITATEVFNALRNRKKVKAAPSDIKK
jgi:hypothetical protein